VIKFFIRLRVSWLALREIKDGEGRNYQSPWRLTSNMRKHGGTD